MAPHSLIEVDRRFRGAYWLNHQGASHISESCHLHTRRRENLKSHKSSLRIMPAELSSSKQEEWAKEMINLTLRRIFVHTSQGHMD
jgi:hypothetical protein